MSVIHQVYISNRSFLLSERKDNSSTLVPSRNPLEQNKYQAYPDGARFSDSQNSSANNEAKAGSNSLPRRVIQRSKPSCTHIDVDRFYGLFCCDICRIPSPLGWLYKCSQDFVAPNQARPFPPPTESKQLGQGEMLSLTAELQALGFSRSVISQAAQGVYTPSQIQILKAQKKKLHATIAAEPPVSPTTGWQNKSMRLPLPLSTPFGIPISNKSGLCHLKCCQYCRPYMIEHCFASFDAVFANELRPLSVTDTYILPVKSALVARTIGQTGNVLMTHQDSPTSQTPSTKMHRWFDSGPNHSPSKGTTPTTATSDTFPYSDYSSSSSDDGHGVANWEDEFDEAGKGSGQDGAALPAEPDRVATTPDRFAMCSIRRVGGSITGDSPAHSLSSKWSGSSASLPTPSTTRTSPLRFNNENDRTDTDPRRRFVRGDSLAMDDGSDSYSDLLHTPPTKFDLGRLPTFEYMMGRGSSTSSMNHLGDDVDVDGGVSLTEESVRTHTPDIITRQETQEEMGNDTV